MPSDVKQLPGRKTYVAGGLEEMVAIVRQTFPDAVAEGSCGSYSFYANGTLAAEAWMHQTRPGW